jgi:hypothetical protein
MAAKGLRTKSLLSARLIRQFKCAYIDFGILFERREFAQSGALAAAASSAQIPRARRDGFDTSQASRIERRNHEIADALDCPMRASTLKSEMQ